jgi:hypothetical protein
MLNEVVVLLHGSKIKEAGNTQGLEFHICGKRGEYSSTRSSEETKV